MKGEGSRVKQSRKVRRNAGVSKGAGKRSKEEESKQQKTEKNVSRNSGISSGAKYDSRVQSRNSKSGNGWNISGRNSKRCNIYREYNVKYRLCK